MVLRITETGEDLVRNLLPTIFGPLRDIYRGHSADDQQQLIGVAQALGGPGQRTIVRRRRGGDRREAGSPHVVRSRGHPRGLRRNAVEARSGRAARQGAARRFHAQRRRLADVGLVAPVSRSDARPADRRGARVGAVARDRARAFRQRARGGAPRRRRVRRARRPARLRRAPALERQRLVSAEAARLPLVQPSRPRPAGELHLRLVGQAARDRRSGARRGAGGRGGTRRRRVGLGEFRRQCVFRLAGG